VNACDWTGNAGAAGCPVCDTETWLIPQAGLVSSVSRCAGRTMGWLTTGLRRSECAPRQSTGLARTGRRRAPAAKSQIRSPSPRRV